MLILRYHDVETALRDREVDIMDLIAEAYRSHDDGRSAVPHSVFLRIPGDDRSRLIGLPAYLAGDPPTAGMKWIASFPDNIGRGLPRASATIVLNSLQTGFPEVLLEGSLISARRTAASAAIAARTLLGPDSPDGVSLVGCGVINAEVLRYLRVAVPSLARVTVFDLDPGRAAAFAATVPDLPVAVAADLAGALGAHRLVSFATTASLPHTDLEPCPPGTVVLHLSLRDLVPAAIVDSHNVVDDADHVCREETSVHLAEQLTGGRAFIDTTIGELLRGRDGLRRDPLRTVVFSPFGLGALDIALAGFARTAAVRLGLGHRIDDFHGVPA